jgi:hypothetical protein
MTANGVNGIPIARESECWEVARVITHHREDTIQAKCVAKQVRSS